MALISGLQIDDESQQIEVALSEAEFSQFMRKLSYIRGSIDSDYPDEFFTGKTVNQHDVLSHYLAKFLRIFDRISICSGYVLDCVYALDHLGGEPLVYARDVNTSPITSPSKYYERYSLPKPVVLLGEEPTYEDSFPYLEYLQFENTPIGCFQFAIFCMTVRRFNLRWHSNYNERKYILSRAELDRFIQERRGGISNSKAELLRSVSTNPKVKIVGKSAQVTLLNFEQNRGYSYLNVYLRHPNIFERIEDEIIIESQIHINF